MARKRQQRRGPLRRLVRRMTALVLVLALATAAPVLALRFVDPPTSAFMLLDPNPELRYEWTPWNEIGNNAALAVLAAEDQKFPIHHGFDLESIRDALDAGGRLRGASTITQQTAKNLFLWPGRSFVRKGIEAYFTVLIELCWPKQRILEVYLNVAEFGAGIYGIGAASRDFFNKPPASLSASEAALLAAVLPNPKRFRVDRPTPYLYERQAWIVDHMHRLRRDGALASLEH